MWTIVTESIHFDLLVNQEVAKTIFPLQQVWPIIQASHLQKPSTSKSLCAAKKVLISQHSAWTEGKFTRRTSSKVGIIHPIAII